VLYRPAPLRRRHGEGFEKADHVWAKAIVVLIPLSNLGFETIPELQKLSTADKFALAVELWDELSSNPDEMPVNEDQLNQLDRRFEEYRQDPDKVVTWEEAKARILSGRR
jgi:putative addiction module component (TIGR02574 family)